MSNIHEFAKKIYILLAIAFLATFSATTLNAQCLWPAEGYDTVTACNKYQFYELEYSYDASKTYPLISETGHKIGTLPDGCDTVVYLVLTLYTDAYDTLPLVTACDETYVGGTRYTESDTARITRQYAVGGVCDSFIYQPLRIIQSSTPYDTTVKGCKFAVYDHVMYYQDTAWNDTTKVASCDSITNIHIIVSQDDALDTFAHACGPFVWRGISYTKTSNVKLPFGKNINGCDSSMTLHLTIDTATYGFINNGNACDSFWWDRTGKTYYTSTTMKNGPKDTIVGGNHNQCDSIITMLVHINVSRVEKTVKDDACDSFYWQGLTLYRDTVITRQAYAQDINGCDSSLYLKLTVNYSSQYDSSATACNSFTWKETYPYTFYQKSTYISDTLRNRNAKGCDSIRNFTLTINYNNGDTTDMTACDSMWVSRLNRYIYTSQVVMTQKLTNMVGCDSSVYSNVTIQHPTPSTLTTMACDSLVWGDQTFTTDTVGPKRMLSNRWGCDSLVTLNLTIHHSAHGDTTATVCDSILWYGTMYYGGTPTHAFPYVTYYGCDSILTLHIDLLHGTRSDSVAAKCDSMVWYDSTYYATTVTRSPYMHYTNSVGCDSAVVLHLTVNYSNSGDTTARDCDSTDWHGLTYHDNNPMQLPTFMYVNQYGCDSLVTLHLALRYSTSAYERAEACSHLIWNYNDYTESGTYYDTTLNAVGCDSVTELTLKISPQGEGGLSGLFEVEEGRYVCFAMGNLQYHPKMNRWQFAEHQYDFLGTDNAKTAADYDGWLDLFGWGTSGYHNPTDQTNTSYLPYETNNVTIDQEYNSKGFGPSTFMDDKDFTGFSVNYDWGMRNAIHNGGRQAGMWRTLTADEWSHLLFYRPDAINKRASATIIGVNGTERVYGTILLPESWYLPDNCEFNPGYEYGFATNEYTNLQWQSMQNAGAIFLPTAGTRFVLDIDGQNRYGYYWSSTHYDAQDAYLLYISNNHTIVDNYPRHIGRSVRLAQDIDGFNIPCNSYGDTTATVKDEFKWYDETLTESGEYMRLSQEVNGSGCDSIVSIHLTIDPTLGIGGASAPRYSLAVQHNTITIGGNIDETVTLFDATGRVVEQLPQVAGSHTFTVATSGVYMLKVGHAPARKLSLMNF